MNTEINLEYVSLLQDCVMLRDRELRLWPGLTSSVPPIRAVMRSTVVQAETRRETNAAFQSVLFHQSSCAIFNVLGNFNHLFPWLYKLARGLPNLSVHFRCPTDIVVGDFRIFHDHAFIVALFL